MSIHKVEPGEDLDSIFRLEEAYNPNEKTHIKIVKNDLSNHHITSNQASYKMNRTVFEDLKNIHIEGIDGYAIIQGNFVLRNIESVIFENIFFRFPGNSRDGFPVIQKGEDITIKNSIFRAFKISDSKDFNIKNCVIGGIDIHECMNLNVMNSSFNLESRINGDVSSNIDESKNINYENCIIDRGVSGGDIGLHFASTTNVTIKKCNIKNGKEGILLYKSDNISVISTTIKNMINGIGSSQYVNEEDSQTINCDMLRFKDCDNKFNYINHLDIKGYPLSVDYL